MEQRTSLRLWQRAADMAATAHRQQHRKNGVTPYFAHPVRVALTLIHVFGCDDEQVIAAALLHDVIEDTTLDYDDLQEAFGERVADLVAALSKDPRLIESAREETYDRQLRAAPAEAKLIKLADVYDNLCDSTTITQQHTMLEKVDRALAIAGHDAALARAVRIVSELRDQVRAALHDVE